MKINQTSALKSELMDETKHLGSVLSRFRIARGMKQEEASLRAGLSRNTIYRLEKGDPGVAIGQILRYIDAIAPGISLVNILSEKDPSLALLKHRERTKRVRNLSQKEIEELDF